MSEVRRANLRRESPDVFRQWRRPRSNLHHEGVGHRGDLGRVGGVRYLSRRDGAIECAATVEQECAGGHREAARESDPVSVSEPWLSFVSPSWPPDMEKPPTVLVNAVLVMLSSPPVIDNGAELSSSEIEVLDVPSVPSKTTGPVSAPTHTTSPFDGGPVGLQLVGVAQSPPLLDPTQLIVQAWSAYACFADPNNRRAETPTTRPAPRSTAPSQTRPRRRTALSEPWERDSTWSAVSSRTLACGPSSRAGVSSLSREERAYPRCASDSWLRYRLSGALPSSPIQIGRVLEFLVRFLTTSRPTIDTWDGTNRVGGPMSRICDWR